MRIELTVNGERREADVWAGESLLFALRERLGLPGSKNACEQGECGSCSVLLDGQLVCSCLVLAAQADGHDVVTVEGLARGNGELHPVQDAFVRAGRSSAASARPGSSSLRPTCSSAARGLPTTRSARHCPAISAAARGTRRSSRPCGWRPAHEHGRATAAGARPRRRERRACRRDPEDHRRVRLLERPRRCGHALGPHGAEPARARPDHANRHLRRPDHARRPRRPDPRGRARGEALRARVRRPAGAGDRPRALLRRAGRAGRRGAPGAGAAGCRADRRRVRAARARRRPRARAPSSHRCIPSRRRTATGTSTTRGRT